MPSHPTNDITHYMFSCFTENHSGLGKSEKCDDKKTIEDIVINNRWRRLRLLCETYLDDYELGESFMAALLNSIDYDRLTDLLRDWIMDLVVDETAEDDPSIC